MSGITETQLEQLSQIVQHLLRVLSRLHGFVGFQNVAIGPNQVTDSLRFSRVGIISSPIGDGDRQVFVTEQIKGK